MQNRVVESKIDKLPNDVLVSTTALNMLMELVLAAGRKNSSHSVIISLLRGVDGVGMSIFNATLGPAKSIFSCEFSREEKNKGKYCERWHQKRRINAKEKDQCKNFSL